MDPWGVVLWAEDVDPKFDACIIAAALEASGGIGCKTLPLEFEFNVHPADSGPQMYHFDSANTLYAAVLSMGHGDTNHKSTMRKSTEFVPHEQRDLLKMSAQEKTKYLRYVFSHVDRVISNDGTFSETLVHCPNGSVQYTTQLGDAVYFRTDHLHRGPYINNVSFSVFASWSHANFPDDFSDGLPLIARAYDSKGNDFKEESYWHSVMSF